MKKQSKKQGALDLINNIKNFQVQRNGPLCKYCYMYIVLGPV